jgi:hypothetical protein
MSRLHFDSSKIRHLWLAKKHQQKQRHALRRARGTTARANIKGKAILSHFLPENYVTSLK